MSLTPETVTRHELNGLHVEVVDATNPDLVGIAGRIVVETMRTVHVDDGSRVRQVPKRGVTFEFALPVDDESGGDAAGGRPGACTDEAAGGREAPGTASKRGSETAAVRRRKSGSREGVAYVTVDGTRLLSRPALRTENAGDSTWR
jgi:ribonuclease P protein subunit POP4